MRFIYILLIILNAFSSHAETTFNSKDFSAPQSPPLEVDDPGTPGPNAWEINFTLQSETSSSEKVFRWPSLDINYGIGKSIQLKYEVPWTFTRDENAKNLSGFANSQVGIKYNFVNIEGFSLAIYPQQEFSTPTFSLYENTLEASGVVTTLPLLASFQIASITVCVNAGEHFVSNASASEENGFFSGIGLGRPLTHSWSLMGDLWEEWFSVSGNRSSRFDIGAIHQIDKNTMIYLSGGHSLEVRSSDNPTLFGTVGVKILLF